jgi:hypothetical protein
MAGVLRGIEDSARTSIESKRIPPATVVRTATHIASIICPVSMSSSAANSFVNAISPVSSHFGRVGLLGTE